MLKEILAERGVPAVWDGERDWESRRREILDTLLKEEYGYLPAAPENLRFDEQKEDYFSVNFCAGHACLRNVSCIFTLNGKEFKFPFRAVIPRNKEKIPFFIHINFSPDVPDKYLPAEELVDNGFAVLSFGYKDITSDDEDMTTGLGGVVFDGKKPEGSDPGKIALWAYAAQRVMDYAMTLPELDPAHSAVCGHSRLGKTALLCGATDTRFACAISNDSGCCGAAIFRDKVGETIENITQRFPYWFCPGFSRYSGREKELSFDQHFLVAAMAPRRVFVGSAMEDTWADPFSEFLSCVAAGGVWEKLGLPGFPCEDALPKQPTAVFGGYVGYHLREGRHFFSRNDWHRYMEFLRSF